MLDFYFRLAVVELGVDPIKFWDYTPRDIDLISEQKVFEYRRKKEFESWKISWLTAPHLKTPFEPKQIYDYEKEKVKSEMTEEEEFESFDSLFSNSETKQEKQKQAITEALKKRNAKLKEQENGSQTI